MDRHQYIVNLERDGKFFSNLKFTIPDLIIPKNLKDKRYFPVYSERILGPNNKTTLKNYILKSAQGFYLCFDKLENDSSEVTIYFEESQDIELQFFVNNFLKTFKNATTNNK